MPPAGRDCVLRGEFHLPEYGGKQTTLLRADGPQGTIRSRGFYRLTDRIENPMGGS